MKSVKQSSLIVCLCINPKSIKVSTGFSLVRTHMMDVGVPLYNVDFDTLTNSKPKERILNALITVFLEENAINPPLVVFLTKLARPYFPDMIAKGINKEILIHYLYQQWTACVSGGICDVDFEDAILNKSFGYLFVFDHLNHIKVSGERFQTIPKSLRIGAYVDENESNDTELEALIPFGEVQ